MKFPTAKSIVICFAIFCGLYGSIKAQTELRQLEETAIQKAVDHVAPAVVQIETIGGLDNVKGANISSGPTTGVIVSEDGYILSSLINFIQQPSSIVVRFDDGEIAPAEIVARDHSRKLVVLKTESQRQFVPVEMADRKELAVGQTTIAIGKIYDAREPNVSVGILSALNRIWDRAVQTDAKISPGNFGGPLIDLNGKMIGVLVPLSPDNSSVGAGSNWYDSGIGFAVPIQDLLQHFERVTNGVDLKQGLLGIAFKGRNIYTDPAEISVSFAGGPAAKAGILASDTIIEVNGRAIRRQAEFKHAIGRLYAGDNASLTVQRGTEKRSYVVKLTGEIQPFDLPAIGVLPVPPDPSTESVEIRHVLSNSPAANAGLVAGDSIEAVEGEPTKTRNDLAIAFVQRGMGTTIKLNIRKANANSAQVVATDILLAPQSAQPLANVKRFPVASSTKTIDITVSESSNRCFAVLPVDSPTLAGVLVWIPEPGEVNQQKFVNAWKSMCLQYNVAVVVPQSLDEAKWDPGESDFIAKSVNLLAGQMAVDPNRVAIGGQSTGGFMAALTCFTEREKFRGLILIDSSLPSRIENPKTSAVNPLLVYMGSSVQFDKQDEFEISVERLKRAKFPIHVETAGSAKLLDWAPTILGWVDTLDRL